MTWRDDVAATGPPVRAGWEILDGLRSIAFTGSARFPLMPVATVYFDRGRIYYAERSGDADVADRLVAAGCLRPGDLADGVIEIRESDGKQIDHLGRLFERVPTLDRQRVVLGLELLTDETVAWIARQSVTAASTEPYDHHPSGVHHWYDAARTVNASFSMQTPRPVIDRQHTPEDLPGVRIAWPEPDPPRRPTTPPPPPPPTSAADPLPPLPRRPRPTEENSSSRRRWDAVAAQDVWAEPDADREMSAEFAVLWPSGDAVDADDLHEPPTTIAATTPTGFDRFDVGTEHGDWMVGIDALSDADPDAEEMSLAVRRAIAAVETGRSRPQVTPTERLVDPLADWTTQSAGSRAAREPDRESHVGDSSPDPHPWESTRTTRMTDEERRTGLQRWFGPKRTR